MLVVIQVVIYNFIITKKCFTKNFPQKSQNQPYCSVIVALISLSDLRGGSLVSSGFGDMGITSVVSVVSDSSFAGGSGMVILLLIVHNSSHV